MARNPVPKYLSLCCDRIFFSNFLVRVPPHEASLVLSEFSWQLGLRYCLLHKLFLMKFPSMKIVVLHHIKKKNKNKGNISKNLQLPPSPLDNHDKTFDDHLFRLGLSLSALIFLLLLEAHNYTPVFSARQTYIVYLITAVSFDIIDTVYFLDLLWQSFVRTFISFHSRSDTHITLLAIF